MLSFFRRITKSRAGIIITFIVLGVIALAFAAGDITGLGHSASTVLGGDSIASVGSEKITATDLRSRTQSQFESYRQQQPQLDMATFVTQGGLQGTLDHLIDILALSQFAQSQGMVASKKLIDGQIASAPSLQGPDGKFSQQAYDRLLAERKMSDQQIHQDAGQGLLAQHLMGDTLSASQVPAYVGLPYASLLLEKREGQIGFIPTAALGAGTPPTPAELTAFYQRNIAKFTVPERRIVRYALVSPETVKAAATPGDADVAQAYKTQATKFAATEKRTLQQVVIGDQAAANALVAKVKAGTPIADAARALGLEPATLAGVEKSAYATQNSPELANAVFAAAKGALVGPIRAALGYTVVRVDGVEQVAAKSLEQAKPELLKQLTADKTMALLGAIHDALDDGIGNKSTFDELVKDQKLAAARTPPLLANGINPDDPAAKPDPKMAQVVAAAFGADEGDDPQLVPVSQDSFAVVALERIVPAAARPLAQVHDVLLRAFVVDRAQRAARKAASDAVATINKGTPIAQALAATKLALPPARPIAAARAQLAANPQGAPPPLVLLFSMQQKTAKLLEAPDKAGWFVIYLDKIHPGNAAGQQNVIDGARADLGKVIGREYIQQFSAAVREAVGVKQDPKAVAQLKAALLGRDGSDQP